MDLGEFRELTEDMPDDVVISSVGGRPFIVTDIEVTSHNESTPEIRLLGEKPPCATIGTSDAVHVNPLHGNWFKPNT